MSTDSPIPSKLVSDYTAPGETDKVAQARLLLAVRYADENERDRIIQTFAAKGGPNIFNGSGAVMAKHVRTLVPAAGNGTIAVVCNDDKANHIVSIQGVPTGPDGKPADLANETYYLALAKRVAVTLLNKNGVIAAAEESAVLAKPLPGKLPEQKALEIPPKKEEFALFSEIGNGASGWLGLPGGNPASRFKALTVIGSETKPIKMEHIYAQPDAPPEEVRMLPVRLNNGVWAGISQPMVNEGLHFAPPVLLRRQGVQNVYHAMTTPEGKIVTVTNPEYLRKCRDAVVRRLAGAGLCTVELAQTAPPERPAYKARGDGEPAGGINGGR